MTKLVYTSIGDRADTITDFELGSDRIVLTQLLDSVGYIGSDPIGDGYLGFRDRGSDSIINIDADGSTGTGRAASLILVQNVTAAQMNNANNFVF